MIISKNKKFIFVSIPKTGTTSIENTLYKYEDSYSTIYAIHNKKHTPFWAINHLSLPYFKFCFFRNPWDQFVSLYRYHRDSGGDYFHHIQGQSFDEWIKDAVLNPVFTIGTEYEYILDKHGFVIPEIKVYKFEEIDSAWDDICKRLSITDKLPHLNKTKHAHYSTYYTNKTRHMIARKCRREIEMMGYEFEE